MVSFFNRPKEGTSKYLAYIEYVDGRKAWTSISATSLANMYEQAIKIHGFVRIIKHKP